VRGICCARIPSVQQLADLGFEVRLGHLVLLAGGEIFQLDLARGDLVLADDDRQARAQPVGALEL
jgi:hypothetical protein